MSTFQSNADVALLAIPMLAALLVVFFRLDVLLGRSRRASLTVGHPLSQWASDGSAICVEPDGRVSGGTTDDRARLGRQGAFARASSARGRARRVSMEWGTRLGSFCSAGHVFANLAAVGTGLLQKFGTASGTQS